MGPLTSLQGPRVTSLTNSSNLLGGKNLIEEEGAVITASSARVVYDFKGCSTSPYLTSLFYTWIPAIL